MKIHSNAQWKSIPLSQNFFANMESAPALCGGIEELTDYTIVSKGKKSGKVLKRPLSCPKKSTFSADEPPVKKVAQKNVFQVVDATNSEDKVSTNTKKKNKNKKNKGAAKPVINLEALTGVVAKSSEGKENEIAKSIKKPDVNLDALNNVGIESANTVKEKLKKPEKSVTKVKLKKKTKKKEEVKDKVVKSVTKVKLKKKTKKERGSERQSCEIIKHL